MSEYATNAITVTVVVGLVIGVFTGAWWVLVPIGAFWLVAYRRTNSNREKDHSDGRTWHI